jgi:hypothetical protein
MNGYKVIAIPKENTYQWLLYKHYARRLPKVILYTFGIYDKNNSLKGVSMFGLGNRLMNSGYAVFDGIYKVETIELQRLVVDDDLGKNVLSFFVSRCLKELPKPLCVYSYADSNMGHHGYIYQATNWIYTGMSHPRRTFYDKIQGKFIHERSLFDKYGSSAADNLPPHIEIDYEEGGKHRYFFFKGDKKQVKEMKSKLSFKVLPYPKGDNKRYDASFVIRGDVSPLF